MVRRSLTLLLIFLPVFLYAAAPVSDEAIVLFRDTYDYIDSVDNRQEGTEGEKSILDFMMDYAQKSGLNAEFQNLGNNGLQHSFSKNLIIRIPGKIESEILFIQKVNSGLFQINNALNPAVSMALMESWKNTTPPVSLTFIFTSADSKERAFLGSSSYIENNSIPSDAAVLYLDMEDESEIPEIFGSVPAYTAPGWLMEGLRYSFEATSLPYAIDSSALHINRAGLAVKEIPLSLFLKEDIPSALIASSGLPGVSIREHPETILRAINDFIERYPAGFPDDWSSNYSYLGLDKRVFAYISERWVILIFLLLISIAMVPPLFHERIIYLNYKKFRHQLWIVPVMFYLSFTFFLISTLMLEEVFILRDQKDLWNDYPLYFFLVKIFSALFLSTLFINVLRGLPFPRNPHFYSYLAFIVGVINLIVTSLFSISFSPILLFSLIFIFLFVITKNKGLKRLYMFLSIVPQFLVLIYIFSRDYTVVYRFILSSRIAGNWVLTLLILPVIAMISSLSFYHHHYLKSRQEMRTAFATLALGLMVVFMLYFSNQIHPVPESQAQRIKIADVQNMNTGIRELRIHSREDLGDITIQKDGEEMDLQDLGTEFVLQGDADAEALSADWQVSEFLDRRILKMTIMSDSPVVEMKLTLESERPMLLYDCPFPYAMDPEGESGRIYIGVNPPTPLEIDLIFSNDSKPDILIETSTGISRYDLSGSDRPHDTISIRSLKLDSDSLLRDGEL